MDVAPPFIVSRPPECRFYRSVEMAIAATSTAAGGDEADVDVFDAHGLRLRAVGADLLVESVEPDELAHVLRRWLGHVDALRESTAAWPLWLLVHAAVEHRGYSA